MFYRNWWNLTQFIFGAVPFDKWLRPICIVWERRSGQIMYLKHAFYLLIKLKFIFNCLKPRLMPLVRPKTQKKPSFWSETLSQVEDLPEKIMKCWRENGRSGQWSLLLQMAPDIWGFSMLFYRLCELLNCIIRLQWNVWPCRRNFCHW